MWDLDLVLYVYKQLVLQIQVLVMGHSEHSRQDTIIPDSETMLSMEIQQDTLMLPDDLQHSMQTNDETGMLHLVHRLSGPILDDHSTLPLDDKLCTTIVLEPIVSDSDIAHSMQQQAMEISVYDQMLDLVSHLAIIISLSEMGCRCNQPQHPIR